MLAGASMLVASKWKSAEIPSTDEWLSKVGYTALMSKLSAVCAYRTSQEGALVKFHEQCIRFTLGIVQHRYGMVYYQCCAWDNDNPMVNGALKDIGVVKTLK